MAPNNIEFFYSAEERSERIWRMDDRLNWIYKWLSRFVLAAASVALTIHLKSRKDMRDAAVLVSQKIEKEGAKA